MMCNPRKKWARPFLLALLIGGLVTAYVLFFKEPSGRGSLLDLSDALFLWGISLLCISLVYVTRFFGYIEYFKKWFGVRPFRDLGEEQEQQTPGDEKLPSTEKRDASLIYASLLLILISIAISYI